VGEDLCRRYRPQLNCDFEVVVYKKNPNLVNAFQTIKSDGRPLIVFSQGLIEHARNEDELAFVLGHEMAHHLEGHLYQQYQTARSGAERFGGLISLVGSSDRLVRNAEHFGARLGGRKFSKTYELEADRLGTWIATIAGYDALRGAAFFMRMSDPGDQLLGTHPPNQARVETVRKAMADLPSP
jgi:predicted Zn-dependent protease